MIFQSKGITYSIDRLGVIHQENPQPYTYDSTYVKTYDTEAYKRQSDLLQALRLGFTIGAHGSHPLTLLDYGYGNGAFLTFAKQHLKTLYGYDVTGIQIEGVEILTELKEVEVITFWDSLEHIKDLSFIKDLQCETIVISLPYSHYFIMGQEWFNEWKHRKPNEHLHHFDSVSLSKFMACMGWKRVAVSTHEDIVRKGVDELPNILTMAFKSF